MNRDSAERLHALKLLLEDGESNTQDALREKLEKLNFQVNQSTISRDLKKLGAIRTNDAHGQAVYLLPPTAEPNLKTGFSDLVQEVVTNGSLIVIHTTVGSASLVARHLDRLKPEGILGTIAGDDTIFIAPAELSAKAISATIKRIRAIF
jgi:transcriptional regulator of arginine metabolism